MQHCIILHIRLINTVLAILLFRMDKMTVAGGGGATVPSRAVQATDSRYLQPADVLQYQPIYQRH